MKNIVIFLIFLVLSSIIVVAAYLWASPRVVLLPKPYFPKTSFSIKNPPSESLTGKVIPVSSTVQLQLRTSDFAKSISSVTPVHQGEEVDTLGNEKASVMFDRAASVDLLPSTQVAFIQTLPVNFVMEQKQGNAVYSKKGNIPISVRALDLLVNIEEGQSNVSVDPDATEVEIQVESGSVRMAFNDTDNQTQIVNLSAGDKYSFNNNTKIGNVKKVYTK